jgi:hypothetical protein
MVKYEQGLFRPTNIDKYKGNWRNIVYRSSWERIAMSRFDANPNVLKWSSEEIVIPYRSPIDGHWHRYFTDFWIRMQTPLGIKEFIIEIKPAAQTEPPKKPKRITKTYVNAVQTWGVNEAKWDQARAFAQAKGMEFQILTENELGIGKK